MMAVSYTHLSISDTELLDKITECVKIQIGAYEKYN